MDYNQLRDKLSVSQRATIAKVQMVIFEELDKCKTEQEVAIFFYALQSRLQNQAINRVLGVNDAYVEIVTEEEKDEANAV